MPLPLLLLGMCGVCSPWSVCEVVVVPYVVGVVVVVTVMYAAKVTAMLMWAPRQV